MKYLLALGALIVALVVVQRATSEEPMGELNPLVTACQMISDNAEAQLVKMFWCRRVAPDEYLNSNIAVVHVKIHTDAGDFVLSVKLRKTPWQISLITETP